jgi:hypothetical protein
MGTRAARAGSAYTHRRTAGPMSGVLDRPDTELIPAEPQPCGVRWAGYPGARLARPEVEPPSVDQGSMTMLTSNSQWSLA